MMAAWYLLPLDPELARELYEASPYPYPLALTYLTLSCVALTLACLIRCCLIRI